MIKIEQEQTRTNTNAIGFQGTPWLQPNLLEQLYSKAQKFWISMKKDFIEHLQSVENIWCCFINFQLCAGPNVPLVFRINEQVVYQKILKSPTYTHFIGTILLLIFSNKSHPYIYSHLYFQNFLSDKTNVFMNFSRSLDQSPKQMEHPIVKLFMVLY